ncbi:Sensor histidine kinase YpdA [compost metagenome]
MVEFPFRIQTPFWLTWWFRVLIVLAVIGIIYLLLYLFFRIRRRFLTQKNDLMELEFKALKSQLNPHFIFNSLNSMQSLLFSKDELTANKYIVSLAKLMRTVLNNSRVDKVALHDEVEFLKSYVLIHSVKLDTQLDLVINTDKIYQIQNYAVRTMILQPFVENSIIHGLSPLEGYKRLSLTFEKASDDYMFVTIEDNGVGRNKANKAKKNISDQYQSVATSILSEKSILVKQMYKEELQYTYTDLFENGKPVGTKVVIKLKLFSSFAK